MVLRIFKIEPSHKRRDLTFQDFRDFHESTSADYS